MALVCWEADKTVGQGATWSADRAQAAEMQDAQQGRSMSLEDQEAAQIAARIGLPVRRHSRAPTRASRSRASGTGAARPPVRPTLTAA